MRGTMLAERFDSRTREVRLEEIPVPQPAAGDVLIEVAYCGICQSDLSLIQGHFPAQVPVVTQGHEASGTIVGLGPNVLGWAEGDRVIPSSGRPCGRCRACRRGAFTDCYDLQLMAFAYDGAWAQYAVVPAAGLTRVPDNVDMAQAALLADAVSTPFAAVVRTAQVHVGNAVGVWGVGGVGTHLLQLAKLAGGVPIIAVDVNDAALERAARLGADHTFRADDPDLSDKIRRATGGRMIDVAFDAVGVPQTVRQCIEQLDAHGVAVTVGLSDQDIDAGPFLDFNLKRKQLKGHLGYKSQDIAMLAEMLSYGRLDLSESISQVVPLTRVEEGIEALATKRGNPIRILVQP